MTLQTIVPEAILTCYERILERCFADGYFGWSAVVVNGCCTLLRGDVEPNAASDENVVVFAIFGTIAAVAFTFENVEFMACLYVTFDV